MQQRSFQSQPSRFTRPTAPVGAPVSRPQANTPKDPLTRIFNTAVISTKLQDKKKYAHELSEISESLPFKAILNAIRQLSSALSVSEKEAAELLVGTFRRMDDVWSGYLIQEGIESLRRAKS